MREIGLEIIAEYMPTEHRHQLGTLDVTLLLDTLEQKGANVETLLGCAGLDCLNWRDPNGKLTYGDKLSIFRVANQNLPNEGLGLSPGEHRFLIQL